MKKKGISLIVLVITIIVIIIIATAVIVTMVQNNPIKAAKEARFKADLSTVREQYNLMLATILSYEGYIPMDELNIPIGDTKLLLLELIPGIENVKGLDNLSIVKGELVFDTENKEEATWAKEIGYKVNYYEPPVYPAADEYIENEADWVIDAEGTVTEYRGAGGKVAIPSTINGIQVKKISLNYIGSVCSGLGIEDPSRLPEDPKVTAEFERLSSIYAPEFRDDGSGNQIEAIFLIPLSYKAYFIVHANEVNKLPIAKITDIKIPEGVTSIDDQCFYGANNLKTVKLPSTLKTIGYGSFIASDVGLVNIPEGLEAICDMAFMFCKNLPTKITLPSSINNIGYCSFANSRISVIDINKTRAQCSNFDGSWNETSAVHKNNVGKSWILVNYADD